MGNVFECKDPGYNFYLSRTSQRRRARQKQPQEGDNHLRSTGKGTGTHPLLPPLQAVFEQLDQMLHFLCLISVKLHDLFLKLKRQCYFFKPQELSLVKASKDFINSQPANQDFSHSLPQKAREVTDCLAGSEYEQRGKIRNIQFLPQGGKA